MPEKYSEEELIEGLRSENHILIEYIYLISKSRLYSSLLKLGTNKHDIPDLIQDSFVTLIANIRNDKFKNQSGIVTYLIGIAKYKHLNNRRLLSSANTVLGMDISDVKDEVELDDMKEEQLNQIRVNLKKLSSDCQDIIHKFYFKRIRLIDLANEYNYQENYIRTKKNRCMKKLKELVIS